MTGKLKYFLSFLFDLPVEKTLSMHSQNLEVNFFRGEYVLSTEKAVYSHGGQYKPFSVPFDRIKIAEKNIGSALLLGLGLGSVPILLKERHVNCEMTCVEIDEKVISLCKKYLSPEIQNSLNIVCEDAYDFVMRCSNKFDLIICDVFIGDRIPEKLQSAAFLEKAEKLLSAKGMLMLNRLTTTDALKRESKNYVEKNFRVKFPDSFAVKTKSNSILIHEQPGKKPLMQLNSIP